MGVVAAAAAAAAQCSTPFWPALSPPHDFEESGFCSQHIRKIKKALIVAFLRLQQQLCLRAGERDGERESEKAGPPSLC